MEMMNFESLNDFLSHRVTKQQSWVANPSISESKAQTPKYSSLLSLLITVVDTKRYKNMPQVV